MLDIPSPLTRINDIREGRIRFDEEMARHVLEFMNYPKQRKVEQGHVDALASQMRARIWLSGGQIAFGRYEGHLYLVNGQHRLSAVVQCGIPQEFQVLVVPCPDERALKELYWRFDAMMRGRSTEQLLSAAGIHEEQHVSKMMAKAVYSAMGFILNDMKPPIGSHASNRVERSVLDFRLEALRPYWPHARAYEKALDLASGALFKRKLLNGGVVAVALTTFRYQTSLAEVFWSRVAANDGLRKGDPCHSLVQYLMLANERGQGDGYIGCCAAAWNAFVSHRSLSILRPVVPIKIKNTPIGAGRAGE